MTSDEIRALRAALTQRAFAALVGVNPRTVQAWEQGRRSPDRWASERLAKIEQERKVGG